MADRTLGCAKTLMELKRYLARLERLESIVEGIILSFEFQEIQIHDQFIWIIYGFGS